MSFPFYAQFGTKAEVDVKACWMISGPQTEATLASNCPGAEQIFEHDEHAVAIYVLRRGDIDGEDWQSVAAFSRVVE